MDSATTDIGNVLFRITRQIDAGGPLLLVGPPEDAVDAYAVYTAVCDNPECPCTEMHLRILPLRRLGDGPLKAGEVVLKGRVSSDGTGVQLEDEKSALAEETVAWVTEQLAQDEQRLRLQERWCRARGQLGDPQYPSGVPPEDRDRLVYFGEVFPYEFDLVVPHEGRRYFADDQYCLNPACTCDEIGVQFVDLGANDPPVGTVKCSLRRPGAPAVEGPPLVEQLWRGLLDRYGIQRMRERFRRMRRVARQHGGPVAVSNAAAAGTDGAGDVGRNQRCPCGSGKKFKRCCGA